jgi:STE24 endopeptidase
MQLKTAVIMLGSASLLIAGLRLWPGFDGMADGGWGVASEIQNLKSEIQDGEATEPPTSTEQAERKELARQYSRGWYWFYFISQSCTFLILFLILWTGFSARLRHWVERLTQRRWMIILIYSGLFIVLLTVLTFPLDLFAFWRERRYGFATQNLTGWLGDELKEVGVALVLGPPAILAVYAVLKKAPRTWWFWGAGVLIGFVIFTVAITPVFIAPLFNTFEPLRDPTLRQRILTMAHEQGIPADEVFQVDASRQSRHTNAYVVGLLGTQRIVLYDTLLENYTPEELEVVMGHEMGHYVLNHIWKGIGLASLLILTGMWVLYRIMPNLINRYQHRLGFRELTDVASLPLLALLVSLSMFALDPITNSFSRYQERQADLFGLRAAPHPAAAVSAFEKFEMLDLSEADPPAFIEFWLYSHPSPKHRIEVAKEFLSRPKL